MSRTAGNTNLKAARLHTGYASQQALADALSRAAPQLGLGPIEVSVRQVRRWESSTPPWPHPDHQRLLVHLLNLPIEELGFTPPWTAAPSGSTATVRTSDQHSHAVPSLPFLKVGSAIQPTTTSADYAAITAAHRRLYATVQPAQIHPAVVEHTNLGNHLLSATAGATRRILAASLAESLLLVGRIEFFDLSRMEEADSTFLRALQTAGVAEDQLLGAAILAHAAFVPGWTGRRDDATERMRAARVYARRGSPSGEFRAWLDAVEAECETRCGHTQEALRLIGQAEDAIATSDDQHASPDWFDWFSPVRLSAFKGNTELEAGYLAQARVTLTNVLEHLSEEGGKQRAVILGDLAGLEAVEGNPEASCARAEQALDLLAVAWYATAMDRIRKARRALQPWAAHECVRHLDDRLYDWETTFSALQH